MVKNKSQNVGSEAVEDEGIKTGEGIETGEGTRFIGDLTLKGTKLTVIGRIPLVRRKTNPVTGLKEVIAEHPLKATAKLPEDHEYRLNVTVSEEERAYANKLVGTILIQKFGIAGLPSTSWKAITNGQTFYYTLTELVGKKNVDKVKLSAKVAEIKNLKEQVAAGILTAEEALAKMNF